MAEMYSAEEGEAWVRGLGRVVAKAWEDDAYKERLKADPAAVLAAEGLEAEPGVELRVVENTGNLVYLVVPAAPSEELSDDALETVAGGSTVGSASTVMCAGTASCPFSTASTAGSGGTAGSG
jgi:Nitrile hydratase, alpha chain